MISRLLLPASAVVLVAAVCAVPTSPIETPLRAQGPDVGTEAQREAGKTLYLKN